MRERALWAKVGGGAIGGMFVVLALYWAGGLAPVHDVLTGLATLLTILDAVASFLTILAAFLGWWKWRSAIRSISGIYRHYNQQKNGEFRADKDENRFELSPPHGLLTISGNLSSGTKKPGTWRTNLLATSLIIEWEGMTIRASKKAEAFLKGITCRRARF